MIGGHIVGRYVLHQPIARGGMATIHIARLVGAEGFSRVVAAKRLHPELAEDPDFVAMFLDEARIASRLNHRNVVPVLDVVTSDGEVILVQELVHGAPLHRLVEAAWSRGQRVPVDIAISIACQVLAGLQAAHDMTDEDGRPLCVVHRDISPQNIMVAVDGTARLLDFGIAKATVAAHTTRPGTFKGKLTYCAPEQMRGRATQRSDVYSLAVVLWELIVGHRMHADQSQTQVIETVLTGHWPTVCEALAVGPERDADAETWRTWRAVDEVVQRGLALSEHERWQTAADMELALARVVTPASTGVVAAWVADVGKKLVERHERNIAAEEASYRRQVLLARGSDDDIPILEVTLTTDADPAEPFPGWDGGELDSPIEPPAGTSLSIASQDARPALSATSLVPADGLPYDAALESARTQRRTSAWQIAVLGTLVAGLGVALAFVLAHTHIAPHLTALPALAPHLTSHARPAAAPPPREPTIAPSEPHVVTVPRLPPRPTPPRPRRERDRPRPAPVPTALHPKDCTPPYYFEGQKKVFKPECL